MAASDERPTSSWRTATKPLEQSHRGFGSVAQDRWGGCLRSIPDDHLVIKHATERKYFCRLLSESNHDLRLQLVNQWSHIELGRSPSNDFRKRRL